MKINEDELCLLIREKLYTGLIIKNYKELCSILHLSTMGGDTKKANLKAIQRYCELERKGHKFIVIKVFDEPKEKEDGRSKINNNKYITLIEFILLNEFIKANKSVLYYTNAQLWESLGMVNSNYKLNSYNNHSKKLLLREIQSEDSRVKQWHVNQAYKKSKQKLIDVTKSALNSLSRRSLLVVNNNIFIARKNGEYFEVTDSTDVEIILQCRRETLNELNCREYKDVIFNKNKKVTVERYNDIMNQKINERLGFEFVFTSYRLICNRKYLKQGLKENIKELKKSLNGTIIDKLIDVTYKDYEKNQIALKDGKTTFNYGKNYIDIQKLIFTKILDIDEKSIAEFITTLQMDSNITGIAFSSEW